MGGFPTSGSRRKVHDVAHGRWRGRLLRRTSPSTLCREALENRLVPDVTLCLAHNTPAGRMELVRSYNSTRFGLPTNSGRVGSCITISGPAQRSLTLQPARSPSRLSDPL